MLHFAYHFHLLGTGVILFEHYVTGSPFTFCFCLSGSGDTWRKCKDFKSDSSKGLRKTEAFTVTPKYSENGTTQLLLNWTSPDIESMYTINDKNNLLSVAERQRLQLNKVISMPRVSFTLSGHPLIQCEAQGPLPNRWSWGRMAVSQLNPFFPLPPPTTQILLTRRGSHIWAYNHENLGSNTGHRRPPL